MLSSREFHFRDDERSKNH